MAMFSGARSQSTTSGGNLVEFKAGRCKMESGSGPTKRKVVAEKEKGLVYVKQSQDQLIHFCWKNRETGALVDDLIIFPGDTEFKEVNGCNDGQVFMLKFKSSDDRRLFWAQDSVLDKDLVSKVNDALNKPPSSARINARGGSSERVSAPEPAGFGSGEELGPLGGLDQRQLMQLLQFMTPNSGGSEAALQNILSGNGGGSEASGGSERGNESQFAQADQIASHLQQLLGNRQRGSRAEIDLADVTTGERVIETVRNNSERLQAHIPQNEGISPSQELIDTIHSPMFRQASSTFGHALQTGQMGPVLEQFGIDSEAKEAAQKGDLLEFAKKLTEAEQGTSGEEPKEPIPKRGKPDDEMELD